MTVEHKLFLKNLIFQIGMKKNFFGKIEDYKTKLNDCILMIDEKLKSSIYKEIYKEVMAELIELFEE